MTDGNTATNISPVPSEDDMSKVRSIIEQGLNSILALSKLSEDLKSLQTQVNSLKEEIEWVRQRNHSLDQALNEVRGQRDTAMRERDEARQEVVTIKAELDTSRSALEAASRLVNSLRDELASVKADRDQAYEAWHKAEEAKEQAEGKLNQIKEYAAQVFSLPVAKEPEPRSIPITDHGNEPAEVAGPAFVYEGDPGFSWERNYEWDEGRGLYRQRAA